MGDGLYVDRGDGVLVPSDDLAETQRWLKTLGRVDARMTSWEKIPVFVREVSAVTDDAGETRLVVRDVPCVTDTDAAVPPPQDTD